MLLKKYKFILAMALTLGFGQAIHAQNVADNHYVKTGVTCFAGIDVQQKEDQLVVTRSFDEHGKVTGFQKDDVVRSVDNVTVATKKQWDQIMNAHKKGDQVDIAVERAGKPLHVQATLEQVDVYGREQ